MANDFLAVITFYRKKYTHEKREAEQKGGKINQSVHTAAAEEEASFTWTMFEEGS